LQICDDFVSASAWGSSPHSYSFRPSVGASGGLLTVWDSAEVEVWDTTSGNYFLMIHGIFVKTNEEFFLFNIYAPCDQPVLYPNFGPKNTNSILLFLHFKPFDMSLINCIFLCILFQYYLQNSHRRAF
jgi:hypothetical protein